MTLVQSFATPKDAMDRLDLDLMLSCLTPPSKSAPRRAASASRGAAALGGAGGFSALMGRPKSPPPPLTQAEEAGMRAVTVANMKLYLDAACVDTPTR